MATETIVEPISDDQPCGLDLDLEEDGAYLNFAASTEAMLPDSFMQEGEDGKRVPFYATQRYQGLDINALLTSGAKLTERTHDLRLLTTVAKLQILNRSLPRFEAAVSSMATLMETFPKDLHPQRPAERAGALERLNDPLIMSAFNNAALFKSRRFGAVTWVSYLAATRADGGAGGSEAVDRILREEVKADSGPIEDAQALIGGLQDALRRILASSAEQSPGAVPDLQKLTDQIAAVRGMMQRVRPRDEETAALESAGQVGAGPFAEGGNALTGAPPASGTLPLLPNAETAEAALAETERFFAAVEPSSPCLLLLRQAQALAGKSFFEALQALVPDSAGKAVFAFGSAPAFDLPLARIAEAEKASTSSADESAPKLTVARPFSTVTSRTEALSLLDQVSAFYRFVEPSSPIPLLIDRVRALSGKDFAALLKAILPEKPEGSGW